MNMGFVVAIDHKIHLAECTDLSWFFLPTSEYKINEYFKSVLSFDFDDVFAGKLKIVYIDQINGGPSTVSTYNHCVNSSPLGPDMIPIKKLLENNFICLVLKNGPVSREMSLPKKRSVSGCP